MKTATALLALGALCFLPSTDALVVRRASLSRRDASRLLTAGGLVLASPLPVLAGASTDLKTDRVVAMNKYRPRVMKGRTYWTNDLPKAITDGDWKMIDESLSSIIDPKDRRGKRKIVGPLKDMTAAMELWASSFSRGAQRSEPTVEMQKALEDFTAATALLELACAAEVKDTGFFGIFGAKKAPSQAERQKNARQALSDGSKAFNAYVDVLNTQLKIMAEEPVPRV